MDTTQTFGQWLRERRKSLDMTQDELAELVGCTGAAIRMIELGQRRPSRQVATLLAEHLRIPEADRAAFLANARGRHHGPQESAATEESPNPTEASIANNLPAQPTALIGRDEDLAIVRNLLSREDTRILTLTGPPGIGKTSLAIEAARQLVSNTKFRDGILWVPLASVSEPDMVIPSIAHALDVQDTGLEPLLDTLKRFLRQRHTLLILDNFEQVVEAAQSIADLSAACPNLKLLVTSREVLNLRAEREITVSPLALPDTESTTREALAHNPAVILFTERAQAADSRFTLTEENAPLVAAICARLDGLPLAIELVAARTRMLPVNALLARLQDTQSHSHLNLLSGGARDLPGRHKTLRDAIGWSYSLLSQEEQVLFRRLGAFTGGFTLSAAEAVCNAASDLSMGVFEGVSLLLHKNLLKRESASGGNDNRAGELRFSMLETIREYARERLEESAEANKIRLLHAEYFLAIASALAYSGVDENQRHLLDRLDEDYANLQAILVWALETGLVNLATQLGISLGFYWELRGYYGESRGWLARILSLQSALPDDEPDALMTRVRLLHAAGRINVYMTDYTTAGKLMQENLALSRKLGSQLSIANASGNLGIIAWLQGEYGEAQVFYEELLKLSQEIGDKRRVGSSLWLMGCAASEQGDFERAGALLKEGLSIGREEGDTYLVSGVLRDMGINLIFQKRYDEAMPLLEEAIALAQRGKFKVGGSWLKSAMGFAVMGQGDYDRAEALFRESLSLASKTDKHRIPDSLEGLAEIELTRANSRGRQERLRRAAILLGAADASRRLLKSKIVPVRAPVRDRLVSEIRSRLGEIEYTKANRIGEAMSLEEALSYA